MNSRLASSLCGLCWAVIMHELALEAWRLFDGAASQTFVVQPSIPILFFGDSRAYAKSKRRIVTVALNPSRNEFPADNPFSRFPKANGLHVAMRSAAFCEQYLNSLNEYFQAYNDPYDWFDAFRPLLQGLDCGFGPDSKNTAIHTDICSPLATDPTWNNLTYAQREYLQGSGIRIWHRLIEHLQPHLILISVRRKYVEEIGFPAVMQWNTVHTLPERKKPYEFRHCRVQFDSGLHSEIVFGQAAQTPFGTVSIPHRLRAGQILAGHLFK